MKNFKKIVSAVLLATMLFTTLFASVSCGGRKTSGFSQFEITYYYGPHGYQAAQEDTWRIVAECGFTSVPLEHGTAANNKVALAHMKKYGLTCSALWDTRIQSAISIGDTMTDEEMEALAKRVVDDYAEFDNIKGWWFFDEPGSDKFEVLGRLKAAFKKVDPNREVFIDLFPTYANPETQLFTKDYYEYVDKYLETVDPDYLCYDHYHFNADGSFDKEFFYNFEIIRDRGLAAKLDYMSIVLLTKFSQNTANVTRTQLLWEANMCLTYGAKRISYFTYSTTADIEQAGMENACVNSKGEIGPHYYDAQAVNAKIYPLGNELFNKTSMAVFHLLSDSNLLERECEAYASYGKLGAVTGEGFVIGFFDDKSFMITNLKYEEGDAGKNTLIFIDVTEGLEYFDVESSTWKAYTAKDANGNYVFEALGGEGVLFRVK